MNRQARAAGKEQEQAAGGVDTSALLAQLEGRIQTYTQQLDGERITRRVLVGQAEELREAIAERDASIAHLQGQIAEARALHASLQQPQGGAQS
ncbi:MAG TPA: hypothetical protein VGV38_17360 [Pyrinomonadaceae bacterium]|nr:hypothetical protein [Pyrinomonadaceae bacterium]